MTSVFFKSLQPCAAGQASFGFSPSKLHCRRIPCNTVRVAVSLSEEPTGPASEEQQDPVVGEPSSRKKKSRRPPKEKLPSGLRRYETTAVLRPDITEDEKLGWTRRYEEAIIAGGATSVEFSFRGIIPLTYDIKRKDMGGVSKTYLDGVYMQISYVTKPQSQLDLHRRFNTDDDIIRSITILHQQHC